MSEQEVAETTEAIVIGVSSVIREHGAPIMTELASSFRIAFIIFAVIMVSCGLLVYWRERG